MTKRLWNRWHVGIFVAALLPRIFGLGQFLTSDERTNIFVAGSDVVRAFLRGDFRGTYWHFYPGVTMSWADGLGMVAQWAFERATGATDLPLSEFVQSDIRHLLVMARLPYALLTALFVVALFALLRRWLDPHCTDRRALWLSAGAALALAFDPFFLAHSRVVHGDAPVSVFMTLSMVGIFLYLRDGGRRIFLFSAAMGALAALTKAPGQFMAVAAVVAFAGDWARASLKNRRLDWPLARRRGLEIIGWGLAALAVFIILWPSMWVDPLGTVRHMLAETFGKVDEGHLVYFMGQPTKDPGLWFYVTVLPFRLTPLTSIGLALSAVALAWQVITARRREPLSPAAALLILLWLYAIALLLFGNLSPKKQDRYLLPLFPVFDVLAVLGLQFILQNSKFKIYRWGLAALVAVQATIALPWHPYYLAYFNQLMGGLPRAVETTLVGWGEGMELAADYLNQKPNAENLFVASTPSQTFLPWFAGRGENFYTNDVALRADYVIIYRAQQQRLAPSPEIVREFMARQPERVVTIHGVPYAWIFPNAPLVLPDVPPDATLTNIGFGEVMRLAGLRLEQDADALTATLFWHALPPIEADRGECTGVVVENVPTTVCPRIDYAVSVRLLAADGAVVAQHDGWPAGGLLPTSQWRVYDYVQDAHTLPLPPDLPAGTYSLAVVVYNAQSQAVLAGPLTVASVEVP